MFEKVNPSHPDKIVDRIAVALVDLAYSIELDPRVAVEVLIGHGRCFIITESSVTFDEGEVFSIVRRIAGPGFEGDLLQNPQDPHLYENQEKGFRCGDNGIFRGVPVTDEQRNLTDLIRKLYRAYPFDGKSIIDGDEVIICQSNVKEAAVRQYCSKATINPLGDWTGGLDVDTGATNRKLGSGALRTQEGQPHR